MRVRLSAVLTGLTTFFLLVGTPLLGARTPGELQQGIQWFEERARPTPRPTLHADTMSRALQRFEHVYRTAPDTSLAHKKAGAYLLMGRYLKARYGDLSPAQRRRIYRNGKQRGREMLERYPRSVPILYATAAHLGRWAKHSGVLDAAREGVASELRSLAKKIIRLDPGYDGGAGYRLLARVHHKTPYIPLYLSWPSEERALELMRKALEIDPDHPGNNYLYGKLLVAMDRPEKARRYLARADELNPRPTRPLVDRFAIYQSDLLLEKHAGNPPPAATRRDRRTDPGSNPRDPSRSR